MKKFKALINEPSFLRSSLFIVFNAFLLYILYFIIKNFDHIAIAGADAVRHLLSAFSVLFIGLLIAYLLDPMVSRIDEKLLQKALISNRNPERSIKKKESICRLLSIFITFIIVIAAVVLIIYGFAAMILGQFVFTDVFATAETLLQQLTSYESEIRIWVANHFPDGFLGEKVMDIANIVILWISDNFSAAGAVNAISGAVGSIVNFVIGLIVSIYLLKDKELFINLWNRLLAITLPQKASCTLNNTLHEVDDVISLFIRGALLDALFVAILSSIGLSLLHIEFAVFIGIFAGICNVIPYFGPVIGMVPAFIMGWLTGDFVNGVLAIVVLLVVQQIDSNIIYPKVVGSSTGLHPLAVLLAVSVFGYFGGILGMLIAVPATGVLQIFIKKWVNKREIKVAERSPSESSFADDCSDARSDDITKS